MKSTAWLVNYTGVLYNPISFLCNLIGGVMDEETLKKQVGNKIKQLRQIKNWSRPQVADKLEMSENNYGCIERGKINISLVHLAQLAEIFDTSIPDLIGADGKNIFNW